MIRSKLAGLAALLCSATLTTLGTAQSATAEGLESVQVGVHGGTLGVGVNAAFDITDQIAARALVNVLGLDYEETEAGNEYEGDLDLQTIGLVADWRLFDSGFRLTGGAFLNNNEVSATALSDDVDIGDRTYEGRIDMLLDFESIAPYFGAGWSSGAPGEPGWGFAVDAGLLYQQAGRISASGMVGDACSFTLSTEGVATVTGCADEPTLKTDLEAEHSELSAELEDFEWYPVLAVGVSYRF